MCGFESRPGHSVVGQDSNPVVAAKTGLESYPTAKASSLRPWPKLKRRDFLSFLGRHHAAHVVRQMAVVGVEVRQGKRARMAGLPVLFQEIRDKAE